MGWIRRLRRWFDPKGEPPTLVRLRARTGEFIEGPVELRARLSNGTARSWTASAAQGLCLVRFQHSERMELELRHVKADGIELRGSASLSRDDVAAGFAPVLWME